LRQVIHNLFANAQEAAASARREAAPARIVARSETVRSEEGAASVAGVRFTVEDNGPGFAANILSRAFEPYVTTKPSGTGLGLAVVRKIVEEHGARIELGNRRSTPAEGAVVTIVFRRLAPAEAAVAADLPQRAA
jgi:nitrogen fixation/metabolism regulation signal transduction histidine kinase